MSEQTPHPQPPERDDTQPLPGTHHHYVPQQEFAPEARREGPAASKKGGTRIVVASLLVGGLAGLAGAAGFSAVDGIVGGDAGTASSSTESRVNTPVVASQDTPAPSGSVESVAASVLPSVVKINVQGADGSAGSGSGVLLSADGEILTNNHVVEVAGNGGRMAVAFNDGSTAEATLVGTDPLTDLAVIKAQGVSGLTPAAIGSSGNLDVGENVVAIGAPFGLDSTVTSGIVSALNRPVSVGESQGTATTYPAIQTDAAINPGNSGGALVNMRGELVGINSSIRTATSSAAGQGGSIGLGFAIPIDEVLPIVDQLRNGETPTHAQLGVSVSDSTSTDGLVTGARIERIVPGSAAADAGVQVGDVVTKVDDQLVGDSQSLVATIRGHRPGDKVKLTVMDRSGDPSTVTVTLGSDNGSPTS